MYRESSKHKLYFLIKPYLVIVGCMSYFSYQLFFLGAQPKILFFRKFLLENDVIYFKP